MAGTWATQRGAGKRLKWTDAQRQVREEPRKERPVPPPHSPGQQEVTETLETGRRSSQMCVSEISSQVLCREMTDREEWGERG